MTKRADEEVRRRAERLAEVEGGTALDAVPAVLRADPELAAAYHELRPAPSRPAKSRQEGPEPGAGRKLSAEEAQRHRRPRVGYFSPGYGIYEWIGV